MENGLDTLLVPSLRKSIEENLGKDTLNKIEQRLMERHGLGLVQAIKNFHKFDSVLREFFGAGADGLEQKFLQKVTLSEIRLAGTVYSFVSSATGLIDVWNPAAIPTAGVLAGQAGPSYMIATDSNGVSGAETAATVLQTTSAEIQPGQQATVIIQLDENVKVGRDAQFKLTTTNGAVFVGTVIAGQQSG